MRMTELTNSEHKNKSIPNNQALDIVPLLSTNELERISDTELIMVMMSEILSSLTGCKRCRDEVRRRIELIKEYNL